MSSPIEPDDRRSHSTRKSAAISKEISAAADPEDLQLESPHPESAAGTSLGHPILAIEFPHLPKPNHQGNQGDRADYPSRNRVLIDK